ncbi:hypothetical protein C3Z14_12505 [Proteus mirabilis]|jgi:hypothetical protein|uniref:hypothetical protein n=1 Tax=Proteus mirabilis TaxID=584 RepID=UPI000CE06010|nr:hypothetical protein [Proteus mirabilis]MCH4257122.1 hypothetical protein [Proteus vulgaris]SUC45728.1 Uncharacterised protein [Providencia stuartii]AVA40786.1 hypothetical protein C3Z14_12505 [Proteus mirabilis]MCI9778404.1 hypothetical protein [Proteus mirabilis]MCL8609470.1 hypothetical protein [Proteus mirabilis]
MQDSIIGIIGIMLMAPAILYSIRLILRILIYFIFSKEKVTITYHDENGATQEKVIYLKRDDEFLSLIDDIAEKKSHGNITHGK